MPCGADARGPSAHRYASLYFLACVDEEDNELVGLETIHHFVEVSSTCCSLSLLTTPYSISTLSAPYTRLLHLHRRCKDAHTPLA